MNVKTNHFDVMILGDGIAGMLLASMLSARHYRTALVKSVDLPLPSGKDPIKVRGRKKYFYEGIWESPFVAAALQDVALSHTVKTLFKQREFAYQFVADDVRVDVPCGIEKFPGDLSREFDDLSGLKPALEGLSDAANRLNAALNPALDWLPNNFWHKFFTVRKNKKEFRKIVESIKPTAAEAEETLGRPPYSALFGAPVNFFANCRAGSADVYSARTVYQTINEMMYIYTGESIADVCSEKVAKRGGIIIEEPTALDLRQDGKRYAVDCGKTGEITADVCVFNMPLQLLPLALKNNKAKKVVAKFNQYASPDYLKLSVTYQVHPDGLPEGMDTLAVYSKRLDSPSPEDCCLFVRDPVRQIAPDRASLEVWRLAKTEGLSQQRLEALTADTHEIVRRVCPFIDSHIYDRYEQRIWREDVTGLSIPASNGEFLYSRMTDDSDFCAPINVAVQKNFFLASPELFLPLNNEAPFAAALCLLKYMTKKVKMEGIG